jgi:hypothetical protein
MIILGCFIRNGTQNQVDAPTSCLIVNPRTFTEGDEGFRTFTERDEHGMNNMSRGNETPSSAWQYNVISAGAILRGTLGTNGLAAWKVRYML